MSTKLTMGVNYWSKADEAFDRGQQAYLDWCRELAVLYTNGSTTQEAIADRYELERVRVTEAIAVGNDKRFSYVARTDLPKSTYSLYLLTSVMDDGFEELCKPTTTQAKILEYKRRLAAPKADPSPPPQRPKCPGVEGYGPGLWKWSEAFGEWEQQPAYVEPRPTKQELETKGEQLKAKNEAARAERHAEFDSSLKGLLSGMQAHTPKAVLDESSPIDFLIEAFANMLQYGGAPATKLAKQMFSSAYHPDNGKVKHDSSLLGSINKALSYLE